jgi:hypothetical protein
MTDQPPIMTNLPAPGDAKAERVLKNKNLTKDKK